MSLFTTPERTPSIRNIPPKPETPLDRYYENKKLLHESYAEYSDVVDELRRWYEAHGGVDGRTTFVDRNLFCEVNAMTKHPELAALESRKGAIMRRRAALLGRNVVLEKEAGLSR